MIQVKIFQEHYAGMLEREVNGWLQDTKGTIEIVNVSSSTVGESKLVYIFYKIKEQKNEERKDTNDPWNW